MLYRFDSFFYKTSPSPCAPTEEGIELSDGDKRGLRLLYPQTAPELETIGGRAEAALTELRNGAEGGLESITAPSPYQARAEALAAAMAEGLRR